MLPTALALFAPFAHGAPVLEDKANSVCMSCRASTPFVNVPHVPAFYGARDFGAKGDGVTKDTKAIQAAVDAAARAGGGEVRLPPGRYLTGSIFSSSPPPSTRSAAPKSKPSNASSSDEWGVEGQSLEAVWK